MKLKSKLGINIFMHYLPKNDLIISWKIYSIYSSINIVNLITRLQKPKNSIHCQNIYQYQLKSKN
jgi:hypothetical protein